MFDRMLEIVDQLQKRNITDPLPCTQDEIEKLCVLGWVAPLTLDYATTTQKVYLVTSEGKAALYHAQTSTEIDEFLDEVINNEPDN